MLVGVPMYWHMDLTFFRIVVQVTGYRLSTLATLLNHPTPFVLRMDPVMSTDVLYRLTTLVISGLTFLQFGCGNSDKSVVVQLSSMPAVCIDITAEQQTDYRAFDVFERAGSTYLLGYNPSNHSLDLFSITNGAFISSVSLERQGPMGVNDVLGIKNASDDKVWLATLSDFVVYDTDEKMVIGRYSLASFNDKFSWSKYAYFFDNHGELVGLNDSTVLVMAGYFPLYNGQSSLHLAGLNVNNGRAESLGPRLPIWINKDMHFGGLNTMHYDISGTELYFNFPFADSLYRYDILQQKLLTTQHFDSPVLPTVLQAYNGDASMESVITYSSESSYFMGFHHVEGRSDIKYRFAIVASEEPVVTYATYLELFKQDTLVACQEICAMCKTRSFVVKDTIFLFSESKNEHQLCFERLLIP